jgi:hypothetical protein
MKDKSIVLKPARIYNPDNQCRWKHPYKLKRRALKDAHELAKNNPGLVFTVYECPHCGKYHVGKERA